MLLDTFIHLVNKWCLKPLGTRSFKHIFEVLNLIPVLLIETKSNARACHWTYTLIPLISLNFAVNRTRSFDSFTIKWTICVVIIRRQVFILNTKLFGGHWKLFNLWSSICLLFYKGIDNWKLLFCLLGNCSNFIHLRKVDFSWDMASTIMV